MGKVLYYLITLQIVPTYTRHAILPKQPLLYSSTGVSAQSRERAKIEVLPDSASAEASASAVPV